MYDNKGRISQKTATGLYNTPMVQNFHYDSKGQLVRCDDTKKNKSTVYNYDSRGNMTSKEDFTYTNPENAIPSQATPTNEATYDFEYDDNVWLDSVQNTSENLVYNGDYIYDENGNVLNVDYEEFHWTNGRELERIDYHMLDDSRIVYASYTYDENGLRTSKTRDDYTTKYIYDGDKLLAEYEEYTVNGTCWHCKEYLYDGNDEMVGYKCDNNVFFFLKDAEGDVIGLVNGSNGNVVEKYSYDPWGAVTGANANSQRYNSIYYRGYYYDIDDSRYYLQSRYYKHQWGSFINADLPEIAQQSKNEVNGLNLFTYCNNDPIDNVDPTGFKKNSISISILYQSSFSYDSKSAERSFARYFGNNANITRHQISNKNFKNIWNKCDTKIILIICHGDLNGNLYGVNYQYNKILKELDKHRNTKIVLLSVCYAAKMNNSQNCARAIASKLPNNGCVFACTNKIRQIVTRFSFELMSSGKNGWRVFNNKNCSFSTGLPQFVTFKEIFTHLKEMGFKI